MTKFIVLITSLFAVQISFAQVKKADSSLMAKSIAQFRGVKNTACQVFSTTLAPCPICKNGVAISINKIQFNMPDSVKAQLISQVSGLREKRTPPFPSAPLVPKFSDDHQRLTTSFMVTHDADTNEIKQMRARIKNEQARLKEDYSTDQLNILEVSEPLYSKKKDYAIVLILNMEPGLESMYLIFWQKVKGNWIFKEKLFSYAGTI